MSASGLVKKPTTYANLERVPAHLVAEIVSPSTEGMDRGLKLAIDAREGVPYLWLVNPNCRPLEVLSLADGHWTPLATHVGTPVVRAEPLDAVELELSALWTS
jgi:Uma2 family endonuclease